MASMSRSCRFSLASRPTDRMVNLPSNRSHSPRRKRPVLGGDAVRDHDGGHAEPVAAQLPLGEGARAEHGVGPVVGGARGRSGRPSRRPSRCGCPRCGAGARPGRGRWRPPGCPGRWATSMALHPQVERELVVDHVLVRRASSSRRRRSGPAEGQPHLLHDVARRGDDERLELDLTRRRGTRREDGDGVSLGPEDLGEPARRDHGAVVGVVPGVDDHGDAERFHGAAIYSGTRFRPGRITVQSAVKVYPSSHGTPSGRANRSFTSFTVSRCVIFFR